MARLQEHMTRRAMPVWLMLIWALAVTLARTLRYPNDFAMSHWLLGYQFGFIKRGLPGEILRQSSLLFGFPITAAVITLCAALCFGLFVMALTILVKRLLNQPGANPSVILAVLVLLTSPWMTMMGHTFGYYDSLFYALGFTSLWCLFTEHILLACILQALALLIHESSLCLLFIPFLFNWWMVKQQGALLRLPHWPILLPLFTFGLILVLPAFTLRGDFVAAYEDLLAQYPFIQNNRSQLMPAWLHTGFVHFFLIESPHFVQRLISRAGLLCLPTLACFTLVTLRWLKANYLSRLSLLVCLITCLPIMMLFIAWDTMRVWSYTIATAFLLLLAAAESRQHPGFPRYVGWLMLAVLVFNTLAPIPLMDQQTDRFTIGQRALLCFPLWAYALTLLRRPATTWVGNPTS